MPGLYGFGNKQERSIENLIQHDFRLAFFAVDRRLPPPKPSRDPPQEYHRTSTRSPVRSSTPALGSKAAIAAAIASAVGAAAVASHRGSACAVVGPMAASRARPNPRRRRRSALAPPPSSHPSVKRRRATACRRWIRQVCVRAPPWHQRAPYGSTRARGAARRRRGAVLAVLGGGSRRTRIGTRGRPTL